MNEVSVLIAESSGGWVATVVVAGDDGSNTEHTVGVSRSTYKRLTEGRVPPEVLVKVSLEFLLEREPKEAILRRFDLPAIGRYFPEYERSMAQRL